METIDKYLMERSPGGQVTSGKYTKKLEKINRKFDKLLDEVDRFCKDIIKDGWSLPSWKTDIYQIDRDMNMFFDNLSKEIDSFESIENVDQQQTRRGF